MSHRDISHHIGTGTRLKATASVVMNPKTLRAIHTGCDPLGCFFRVFPTQKLSTRNIIASATHIHDSASALVARSQLAPENTTSITMPHTTTGAFIQYYCAPLYIKFPAAEIQLRLNYSMDAWSLSSCALSSAGFCFFFILASSAICFSAIFWLLRSM